MQTSSTNIFLVFDLGKTNKKVLYYSHELELLSRRVCRISAIQDGEYSIEDMDGIFDWLMDELRLAGETYSIDGIGISCHGGAFALLDEAGKPAFPVLSYTSEVGSEFNRGFYEHYGSEEELQKTTGSPDLGFVNVGKQIHYIKKNAPGAWEASKSFLFYAQYLGFLLTGKQAMEVTYLGNHTFAWDFQNKAYSDFAVQSGLKEKIPLEVRKPYELLGTVHSDILAKLNLKHPIPVTVGIHDSNAAMLPYLLKEKEGFNLLSTGTWCVGLKPNQPYELSKADLETKTFFNLDAFGNPLRTSICPIGYEYEEYSRIFGSSDPNGIAPDLSHLEYYLSPGILDSTSIFKNSRPGIYEGDKWISYQELRANPDLIRKIEPGDFYLALNASLAIQTAALLSRLHGAEKETVYLEGGFAANQTYLSCLLALRPDLNFKVSTLQEATAYGTALTVFMALKNPTEQELRDSIEIKSSDVHFPELPSMGNYLERYYRKLGVAVQL